MASDKKEVFLLEFRDLLERERVPERARPYYIRHLDRWGLAFRQRPAGIRKKDFLEGYLRELSHTAGVELFVVHQTAEAVRLAHEVLLGEEWARQVDWEGLRAEYRADRYEVPGEAVAESLDRMRASWAAMGFSGEQVESLAALVRMMREGSYALRTEENYLQWVVRLMVHGGGGNKPPERTALREGGLPGVAEAEAFLSDLAVMGGVVMGTQKQALNALVFYLKRVRGFENVDLRNFRKAKESQRLPVVLSKTEILRLLDAADGEARRGGLARTYALMLQVMYASGLRVMECVRLRVKDVDFDNGYVMVRQGKGNKDRRVPLARRLVEPLREHLEEIRGMHAEDRAADLDGVFMPGAHERKWPGAGKEWTCSGFSPRRSFRWIPG